MRRFFSILTTSIALIAPALGANPVTDKPDPELLQCTAECAQKKDAADREACDIKCAKEDAARHPQNVDVPITQQGSQPQK